MVQEQSDSDSRQVNSPDKAALTEVPGWFEEELGYAWKHLFPITPASIRSGKLPLDHNAWSLTPNPWWKFYTDVSEISLEAAEELSRQRRPSITPHWDKSEWIIQERKFVNFRGMAIAHWGNHPTLKLIQLMAPVQRCDVLLNCREEISSILKHMIIWKLEWGAPKDLLRRMGWSMVDTASMNTNPSEIEVPLANLLVSDVNGQSDFRLVATSLASVASL
nr:hypothetical protein CFP56_76267 [Quercus suber]